MDCEKFEPLLLDELYEELDELTSAAVKRHVSGCSRCASILNGMRSTRRAVTLPIVTVPAGLEERILAAAKEAQKVVPIKSRMSRVLSIAGSWAMRPQTAMAAVFLLMIGTSAFLIRSKNYASKDSTVSVTVAGAPAPTASVAQSESLDDKAAAAAHGPTPPNVTRPPAAPAASGALALGDDANGFVDHLTQGAARDKGKADESGSLGSAFNFENNKDSRSAPPPVATQAPAPIQNAGPMAGAPGGAYDGPSQQPAKPYATKRSGPADQQAQDPFSLGAAAFRTRNFAEATRQFDAAASSGDPNAALWAAESTREGQGCAVALGRFDSLSQKAAGSWIGNEASLRAARCQVAMSQLDPARDRLNKLTQVQSHQQAAQLALAELNQVAARKAGGASGAGAAAAPAAPRRAAPAARPASPVRAPSESAEKKQTNSNSADGF
jgi:hypothetical protein